MKTPRELLLKKHQGANAGLDSLRRQILETECRGKALNSRLETCGIRSLPRVALKLWSELIQPARRVWAGFALAWLMILAVNVADSDHSQPAQAKAKPVSAGTLLAFKERQKILAELMGTTEPVAADKRKPVLPRPRSQRQDRWRVG